MMTLKAAAAYIVRLRKEAKLSRLAFAKAVSTSDSNLLRIERGEQEAGSMLLALIVRTVDANPEDIIDLLLMEDAKDEIGIERAEEWIKKRDAGNRSKDLHPDIVSLVARMSDYELGRWVSIGERLLEERNRTR